MKLFLGLFLIVVIVPVGISFYTSRGGKKSLWMNQKVHYSAQCAGIVQQYLHSGTSTYIPADKWIELMQRVNHCEHPNEPISAFPVTAQDSVPMGK